MQLKVDRKRRELNEYENFKNYQPNKRGKCKTRGRARHCIIPDGVTGLSSPLTFFFLPPQA